MMTHKLGKLGQTDLVFFRSEFISSFVPPLLTHSHRHTLRQFLTSYTISSASWAKNSFFSYSIVFAHAIIHFKVLLFFIRKLTRRHNCVGNKWMFTAEFIYL